MFGGTTACHKVSKLSSVQISINSVDLRPILFSSLCVTFVTLDSQNSSPLFIHLGTDAAGKYQYSCCKKKKKRSHLVPGKLHSVLVCCAQCHLTARAQEYHRPTRTLEVIRERDRSKGKGVDY